MPQVASQGMTQINPSPMDSRLHSSTWACSQTLRQVANDLVDGRSVVISSCAEVQAALDVLGTELLSLALDVFVRVRESLVYVSL